MPHRRAERLPFWTTKPTPGRWYWKDDTKTLEFASYSTASDFKERARKARAIHFQDAGSTMNTANRSTPNIFKNVLLSKSQERSFIGRRRMSRPVHEHITLEDVKNVALELLDEHEQSRLLSFASTLRSQQLDDFLMALVFYLSCYLEKIVLDKKPKSLVMNLSKFEMQAVAGIATRTELAKKHFAQMYCILVLGVGMPEQHHMACGRSKASSTQKDQKFYECLYKFCTCVAWVVFRRQDLTLIQEEVGRILRSDTFNPALRLKGDLEESDSKLSIENKKTAKSSNTRPAIKSIINQRSPALTSLMPSTKEKAEYLFQKHQLHPVITHRPADSDNWIEMSSANFTTRVGILGERRKFFNPQTLIPLAAEDDEHDNKSRKSNTSFNSQRPGSAYPTDVRSSTAISRATTEAGLSDAEEE
ncbi:protein phosphatase 1 regulatory subunit 36 isoform X2 [Ambystoma mexicanum]|uniref:protein phosphatase 1 regulatory subunit 36 isoform X2 n=1 Tax=Ambystoma mexicanum TaxID=8296 RepID=UPI0037E947DB